MNFSLPTANPMRLMHSMVLPRSRRCSGLVAFSMMYFRQGTNLRDLIVINICYGTKE